MMRRFLYILAAAAAMMSTASCGKLALEQDRIALHASMKNVPSKGTADSDAGIRDYDYPDPLNIALVRVDENHNASYPGFKDIDPLTAVMQKPDVYYLRDIEFGSVQYFYNETDKVRFASWYPASGQYDKSTSKVTFDINGAADILYGTVAEGSKAEGFNDIVFNHALCQFNIYVYKMNEGGEGEEDWGVIENIEVKKVHKTLQLTLPQDDENKYSLIFPEGSGDFTDLALSTAEGVYWNPGSEIPFGFDNRARVSTYLTAPPVDGYITLGISTSTRTPYQQISIAKNFQSGCAYDIILRFTEHGIINAEVSVGKWNYYSDRKIIHNVNADMYYDLSSYMTANSYVVPSGNYGYSIRGDVKGNSSEKINPGYIDILWSDNENIWDARKEENENYVKLASHSLSKDRIMFKVGDVEGKDKTLTYKGNLVIAAYDNKNKDNILWTWHIWFNDNVAAVGLTNGYLALNQDLGATAEGSEGLYYQWGRKDPFKAGAVTVTVSESQADVETTVRNPRTFYSKDDSWYSGSVEGMKGFWGWERDDKDIVKSMYDPCPPGYQVPNYRMWGTGRIAAYQTSYADGKAVVNIASRDIVFPLSGYLGADGQKKSDRPLLLWSASLDRNGEKPYSFLYPDTKNSPVSLEEHRNYGAPVRCVAKSQPVVKNLSEAQTANSYIISSDGYYKFKATVAGNGVSSLITDKGNEWDVSGTRWGNGESVESSFTPDRVEYLWYQPAINGMPESITTDDICVKILEDGRLDSNGYVNLEVVGWKPGNVILAAYKGDDILWSWHLWLTEKPKDLGNGIYALMDRNLGATRMGDGSIDSNTALETYGFYYQWGRKDPFAGPPDATVDDSTNAFKADESDTNKNKKKYNEDDDYSSSRWFEFDKARNEWTPKTELNHFKGPVSIKKAAAIPQYFINVNTETGTKFHWMTGYLEDDKYKILWGYAIEGELYGTKPNKTMYDPCPPGYMVPHHWVYWNAKDHAIVTSSDYRNNLQTTKTHFQKYGSFGYKCTRFGEGNYLPLSGRRMYKGGFEGVGKTGYLWGSTPKNGGRLLAFGRTMLGMYQTGTNSVADAGADQAFGQSVRCLKQ